ncbi:acyl carrier protein [Streptomyces sp. TRM66268-LWL]|uniref:Acyl carrier protein n=1 Tax=Streptomyces polyasparticus TaxID=2767826 RepID=A0ABR7SLX7_9ACTN|nr:acyl carrier protein [Streptomyces polyasparticus]MBC9716495.1 acyl carrier protein [Streptomyces polyasparticus]
MFKRSRKQSLPEGPVTEEVLRGWLVEHLAGRVNIGVDEVDTAASFESYGLDSRAAVQVSGALEKLVERRLSPALLYEHPNIDALTGFLAKELRLTGQAG